MSGNRLEKALLECLDPSRNMVVRACAGSGKTWLLISRIVRILFDDPAISMSSILAITYTTNATAEIRSRVHERLREMRDASDSHLDVMLEQIGIGPGEKNRDRARRLHDAYIIKRPKLTIRTFHSWFSHLISHLPWDVRITHNRQTMTDATTLRRKAWRATIEAATQERRLGPAMEAMLGFHKPAQVRSMLDTMLEKRTEWYLYFGKTPDEDGMEGIFMSKFDEKMPRPEGKGEQELLLDKGFGKLVESLSGQLGNISAGKSGPELGLLVNKGLVIDIGLVRDALLTQKGTLRAKISKLFSDEAKNELEATVMAVLDVLRIAENIEIWKELRKYNEIASILGCEYARQCERLKQQEGMIEFTDMEIVPLQTVLAGHGGDKKSDAALEMLESLSASYRHILVDELQDTSPAQWRMMREWLEMSEGGNKPSVFVVGDPKQSIYGFRGGNPKLIDKAARYLEKAYDGKEVRLNVTRRCSQPVVDLVNGLFFGDQPTRMEGFEKHTTLAKGASGLVACLHPEEEEEKEKEEEPEGLAHLRNPLVDGPPDERENLRATQEGTRIAEFLKETLPKIAVQDGKGNKRPCEPGDVILLFPTRSNSEAVCDAIEAAGLPCGTTGKSNRLNDLECQDMIALLRSIYDPAYALAVAQVLRSPVFSLSEDDLWQVHVAGLDKEKKHSNWAFGLARAKGSKDLERAKKLLSKWRSEYCNEKLPAHETLARCYHDANIVERYVAAVPEKIRKQVGQNLEWILNHAIEAGGGRYAQLPEYVRYLEDMTEADNISDAQDGISGAIRAMTVHGAKGLEGNVVVIANANYSPQRDAASLVVGWGGKEVGDKPSHISFVRTKKRTYGEQEAAIKEMQENSSRENKNLLYVAATRAKNVVAVSSRMKKAPRYTWASSIEQVARDSLGATEKNGMLIHGQLDWGVDEKEKTPASQQTEKDVLAPYAGGPDVGALRMCDTPQIRRGKLLHNLLAMRISGVDDSNSQRKMLALGKKEFDSLSVEAERIMSPDGEFGKLLKESDLAEAEVPLFDDRKELRADCLLSVGKAAWVIDFKTGKKPNIEANRRQVGRYRRIVEGAGGFEKVRAALVDSRGSLEEIG